MIFVSASTRERRSGGRWNELRPHARRWRALPIRTLRMGAAVAGCTAPRMAAAGRGIGHRERGQYVTAVDAGELAAALERALNDIPETVEPPELTLLLQALIEFCRGGGFTIK